MLDESLRESAGSKKERGTDTTVQLFWNTTIDSDLCVLVQLDHRGPSSGLDAIGVALTEALQEHGVVEHSTWFAYQPNGDSTDATSRSTEADGTPR